jgi:hypothetical protein
MVIAYREEVVGVFVRFRAPLQQLYTMFDLQYTDTSIQLFICKIIFDEYKKNSNGRVYFS